LSRTLKGRVPGEFSLIGTEVYNYKSTDRGKGHWLAKEFHLPKDDERRLKAWFLLRAPKIKLQCWKLLSSNSNYDPARLKELIKMP
jgi:hypothetical protein